MTFNLNKTLCLKDNKGLFIRLWFNKKCCCTIHLVKVYLLYKEFIWRVSMTWLAFLIWFNFSSFLLDMIFFLSFTHLDLEYPQGHNHHAVDFLSLSPFLVQGLVYKIIQKSWWKWGWYNDLLLKVQDNLTFAFHSEADIVHAADQECKYSVPRNCMVLGKRKYHFPTPPQN